MSKSLLQTLILLFLGLALSSSGVEQTNAVLASFSTDGHTAYHLRAAVLAGGQRGMSPPRMTARCWLTLHRAND